MKFLLTYQRLDRLPATPTRRHEETEAKKPSLTSSSFALLTDKAVQYSCILYCIHEINDAKVPRSIRVLCVSQVRTREREQNFKVRISRFALDSCSRNCLFFALSFSLFAFEIQKNLSLLNSFYSLVREKGNGRMRKGIKKREHHV